MKSLTAELADHGRFMGPRHVPPPKRGPHRAAQRRGTTPGLRWIDPRTGGEQPGDSQSEDHSSIPRHRIGPRRSVTLGVYFVTARLGVKVRRSDGAKTLSLILSELDVSGWTLDSAG